MARTKASLLSLVLACTRLFSGVHNLGRSAIAVHDCNYRFDTYATFY